MIDTTQTDLVTRELIRRIRSHFPDDGSGHGFDHIMRVHRLALAIAGEEKADLFVVSVAALLHDVGDYKLTGDGKENHRQAVADMTEGLSLSAFQIEQVTQIVERVSFKGNGTCDEQISPEGQCVRDADRLDAMGAIGIARAFAYGALKGRPMFNQEQTPGTFNSFEAYKNNKSHTINHFHEKLLLLRDRMNTATGRRLAEKRHAFLVSYLDEFRAEWEGSR